MFRYEINYWDEYDNKQEFEKGIISAENYGIAANKIVDYYGEENIIDIKLCPLEEILTDDDLKDIYKGE